MRLSSFIIVLSIFAISSCKSTQETTPQNAATQIDSDTITQEPFSPQELPLEAPEPLEEAEIQPSPQKAHELYLLASYAQLQPSPSIALASSEKAYELDPNPETALKYLQLKLLFVSDEEAVKIAEKMALLFPQDPALQLVLTEQYIRAHEVPRALQACEKAYELAPTNEGIFALFVSLLQKENQQAKAKALCYESIKKNPSWFIAYSLLAELLIAEKEWQKATVIAGKAHELANKNFEITVIYSYLLLLVGDKNKAMALHEELFHQGSNEKDIAIQTTILGKVFGSFDQILANYENLAKSPEGQKANFSMLRVFLLWQLKKYHQAIDLLQTMATPPNDASQVAYMLALTYEKIKEPLKAYALYKSIPAENEHYLEARFRLISILREQKDLETALATSKELCENRFATPEVFSFTAQILSEMKRLKESVQIIEKGRTKYPEQIRLLFLRGVYEEKMGEINKCIATMQEVISKDPSFSSAYNYLAYLYAQNDMDLNEAQKLVEKALEYRPQDGYYLDTFAWILFKKGKPEDALAILRETIRLLPNEGVVWEHIGDILLQQNEKEAALEIFKKAMQLDMEDEDKTKLGSKIKSLEGTP